MYFPKPSINENDLAIIERGDTASHSIEAGQYVSWKGKLGKAKAAILQGATLDDTLFDYDENGTINEMDDRLSANVIDASVNINSYTSGSSKYICPSDGYLHGYMTVATTSSRPMAYIYDANDAQIGTFRLLGNGSNGGESMVFLKKGMRVYIVESSGNSSWKFVTLKT